MFRTQCHKQVSSKLNKVDIKPNILEMQYNPDVREYL